MTNAPMRHIEANGISLAVAESGPSNGPTIIFANSLGTDRRIWAGVLPLLPDGLRIICYDERGQGSSETPPSPYSIDDHVSDLAGLLDVLDVDACAIVGLSIGGLIAQQLGASQPQRIRALVLVDTGYKIGSPEFWNARIAAVRSGGLESIADAVFERWFSSSFRATRADELISWRGMLVDSPVEGYIGSCAAIRDANTERAARSIRVPTLVLCGSQDLATPTELVRAMADIISSSRFILIEGSGHLPCIEKPAQLAFHIGEFLKEHGFVR